MHNVDLIYIYYIKYKVQRARGHVVHVHMHVPYKGDLDEEGGEAYVAYEDLGVQRSTA